MTLVCFALTLQLGYSRSNENSQLILSCTFSILLRFPMTKGVAGHVASHGEVLNVTDAYSDKRFNREVDAKTGYTTNTLLCVPVICKHR